VHNISQLPCQLGQKNRNRIFSQLLGNFSQLASVIMNNNNKIKTIISQLFVNLTQPGQ
jgi:hypothetical protein